MKKIEAYVKKHRLQEVIERLHVIDGLTGASVHDIVGFGRTRQQSGPVHIVDDADIREPHVRVEVFCNDTLKQRVVEAIAKGAHTGLRADGKIYVSSVEEAVRISTGERGEAAI